jgi:hypothetical protein
LSTTQQLMEQAQQLAARLQEDIQLCRTRDEHIRVTARANEAANLVDGLVALTPVQYESASAVVTDIPRDGTVNA